MRTSPLLLCLLAPLAAAIPAESPIPTPTPVEPVLAPRAEPLASTAPWISVDKKGKPSTVTPVPTEIDGEPTVSDGAPHALTGTVFTFTNRRQAKVTTSTGAPPAATARNKQGKGAFPPCHNADGPMVPFCLPEENSTVFIGTTYYVTWDPSLPLMQSNTTQKLKVKVKAYRVDTGAEDEDDWDADETEEEEAEKSEEDELVLDPDIKHNKPAIHGFFPWDVTKRVVPKGADNATVRLTMQRLIVDDDDEEEFLGPEIPGPTVLVLRPARADTGHGHAKVPVDGAELYIALPILFGFVALVLIVGCVYNRSLRQFGTGNVMGVSRKAHSGRMNRAKRLLKKMGGGKRGDGPGSGDEGVQLLERDLDSSDDEDLGHDRFAGQEGWSGGNAVSSRDEGRRRAKDKEGYKES